MPGKREENRERTKQDLIRVAQDLLEVNNHDAPISAICENAGVAVGTFYNYFKSKNDLLDAAAEAALMSYSPHFLKTASEIHEDPAISLFRAIRLSIRLACYMPRLAKIIVAAGPQAFTTHNPFAEPALKAIEESVKLGFAKCSDPGTFLVALSGAYQNVLAFSLNDEAFSEVNADQVVAMFMRELGYGKEQVNEVCFGPIEIPELSDPTL